MTERDTPKMAHDEMIDTLKGLVFGTFDRTTAKEREALDMAISALKGGWIPITTRPMTEEEITSYDYYNYFFFIDEPRIMDCKLPDDGEEVEVTINGKVVVDTFYNDGNEGCYFDSVNIEDVTAWRRCEPYKKGE